MAGTARYRSERGAVLVHVAIGLIALLAFSALAIDYGILWVSRGQAQNAADAAAMAAAVARAYDNFGDKSANGPAVRTALAIARQHLVFGEEPSVTAADVSFPPCPDHTDSCVRVDVYRNEGRRPLPTVFGRLVGIDQQGVRATATAQAAIGNAVNCLKPWAVADKWGERRPVNPGVWTVDSTFDKYDKHGNLLPAPVDYYVAPTTTSPGTGFHPFNSDGTLAPDYGLKLTLKLGDAKDPGQVESGWFLALALDGTGGSRYEDAIEGCVGGSYSIGQAITTEPGKMVGPTKHGVDRLLDKDYRAYWDPSMNGGRGGVAGSAFPVSPRIVPVPVFDVDEFLSRAPAGRDHITLANILGFFVSGMNGNDVEGYLITLPGEFLSGASSVGSSSAWVRTVRLVR